MKKILALYIFFSLLSCNNSNSSFENIKSAEELRIELKSQEEYAPNEYLQADGKYNQNFLGTKFKINCVIKNKATLATFKDAILKVSYYSKTNTEISSKNITLYENFPPSSTKTIELKVDNFKDVNSIGWTIINATAVQ